MQHMRIIILGILTILLSSCNHEKLLLGEQILTQSIKEHDSLGIWNQTKMNLHIQEPRVSNPYRYSILHLNNSNNAFVLTRNRDNYITKHIIESNGNSLILLDGKEEIDSMLIKKYRLDPSMNINYRKFYKSMYGLPMSLSNSLEKILETTEDVFNGKECYKIELELKEEIISKYWNIYISKSNNRILGMDIIFPDKPGEGERLYFEEIIEIEGIKIPRIRHWHKLKKNEYSGTDIIITEIKE